MNRPALFIAALRQTDAAKAVGMTPAQFDRAVACGEMPDPIHTSAGER